MPAPDEPTALYRYFDTNDDLLYIGISNNPDFRWKAHLYGSDRESWPKQVARRTVEWHNSRVLALKAEEDAIKAERPLYNGKHNYDDAPFDPKSWSKVLSHTKVPAVADLIRSEITSRRWTPGQRIPSLRNLADAAGVSTRIVSKASAILQNEGLLGFQPGHGLFVHTRQQPPKLPHDWFYQFGFPG